MRWNEEEEKKHGAGVSIKQPPTLKTNNSGKYITKVDKTIWF
jgi:hypothetical protein